MRDPVSKLKVESDQGKTPDNIWLLYVHTCVQIRSVNKYIQHTYTKEKENNNLPNYFPVSMSGV